MLAFKQLRFAVSLAILSSPLYANQPTAESSNFISAYGVSAQIGTLGFGLNLTRALYDDYLNIRLQGNYLKYNFNYDNNNYNVDAGTYGLLLDYMPLGGVFRVSGGLYYDNRSINTTSNSIDLGDGVTATGSAGINFAPISPYLGIGVGSQAASSIDKKGIIVSFDAGVLFQSPQVATNLTCSSSNCQNFDSQLNQYQNNLQNDMNQYFRYYPVLSFGLGYRF